MSIERRDFIVGSSAFLLPGKRWRFRSALRRAIEIKGMRVALDQRIVVDGSVATISDHTFRKVEQDVPFFNILTWILENWELVLKLLLFFIAILETS